MKRKKLPKELEMHEADEDFFKGLKLIGKNKEVAKKFIEKVKQENIAHRDLLIETCIDHKIFTKKLYEKELKNKYIKDGLDSIIDLMRASLHKIHHQTKKSKHQFITENKKVLKDKNKLEKIFNVKIINIKEAIDQMETKLEKEKKEQDRIDDILESFGFYQDNDNYAF